MLLKFALWIYSHLSNYWKSITVYYNHVSALKTWSWNAGIDCSIIQCTAIATAVKVEFRTSPSACFPKHKHEQWLTLKAISLNHGSPGKAYARQNLAKVLSVMDTHGQMHIYAKCGAAPSNTQTTQGLTMVPCSKPQHQWPLHHPYHLLWVRRPW